MLLQSNTTVQRKEILYGWSSEKPIQVYVLSGDGKWYLQPKVVWRKWNRFTAVCYFGNESTQSGTIYKVIAIASDERPHSPLDTLPPGKQSLPLTVILE